MALVYALWPRWEPRPLNDHAIDRDLGELCLWIADQCLDLERADVQQTLDWSMRSRAVAV